MFVGSARQPRQQLDADKRQQAEPETGRLAAIFPEPAPGAQSVAVAPDYYRRAPGSAEHREAYRQRFAAADGTSFAHPDPDLSYEIDNADELAAERHYEDQAERHYRELPGREAETQRPCTECGQAAGDWHDPGCRNDPALAGSRMPGPEPGEDAARWTPEMDAPDDPYGFPERAEADPEAAHFGWATAEPQDAGRFPLPRVLDPDQASPVPAPVAAALAGGTPHADPFLAERGWQARSGVYVRQPQAQLEAG